MYCVLEPCPLNVCPGGLPFVRAASTSRLYSTVRRSLSYVVRSHDSFQRSEDPPTPCLECNRLDLKIHAAELHLLRLILSFIDRSSKSVEPNELEHFPRLECLVYLFIFCVTWAIHKVSIGSLNSGAFER